MYTRILHYLIIVYLICMTGCTDFRRLQIDDSATNPYDLSVGDTVLLVTNNDQRFEFEITDITSTSLVGKHVVIPFDQIRVANREEIHAVKTTAAVSGGVLVAFLAGLMIAFASI